MLFSRIIGMPSSSVIYACESGLLPTSSRGGSHRMGCAVSREKEFTVPMTTVCALLSFGRTLRPGPRQFRP